MIHVENLTKSFRDLRRGEVHAVDHVSFDAQPGEIFGLLGPNGAGKTTTMRILCTVLRADRRHGARGRLRRGHPARPRCGSTSASCPPTPAIYDRMSAWEMVEYFGRLYGLQRGTAPRAHGRGLRHAANERLPRRARRQDEHGHEAESFHRPGHRPRPAGADLRRTDRSASTCWWPGPCCENIERLRCLGKCILFSTHIMREVGKALRPRRHRQPGVASWPAAPSPSCGQRHGQQDLEELFFQLVK